ncbi:MAG: hypothetical protein VYB66_03600 [Verrucomicrobiota bacterium]|nr:hypothetical protein [Verrucomicrobiota bacterium]
MTRQGYANLAKPERKAVVCHGGLSHGCRYYESNHTRIAYAVAAVWLTTALIELIQAKLAKRK